MKNSKEVIILVIMIFVVLVSAAKADDESLSILTENVSASAGIEYFELDKDAGFAIYVGGETDSESSLELGVVSTSSMSNLEDDYGLVVTLTTLF